MKLRIHYATEYRYSEEVSFSPHVFRLLPKADLHLTVERFDFRTNERADVQQLDRFVHRVQAHRDSPGAQRAVVGDGELRRVLQEDGDAVAG